MSTRAISYARVSNNKNGTSRSTNEQHGEMRGWCERRGWTIVEEFTDDGIGASTSSKKLNRPGYEAVLRAIEAGQVDVLVLWSMDRSTRRLSEFEALFDLLARRGVILLVGGREVDPSDPSMFVAEGVGAVMASGEVRTMKKRSARALRSRAVAGEHHGRPPFGLRRVVDVNTAKVTGWEPDPVTAPIVRRMADELLKGRSLRTVATTLNSEGITTNTGSQWHPQSVRDLLRRASLVGMRDHNGQLHPAQWDAVLDLTTWRAVQELFEGRKITSGTKRSALLGGGILVCGRCGGHLSTRMLAGQRRYTCRVGQCVTIGPAEEVEQLIIDAVCAFLDRADVRQLVAEAAAGNDDPLRVELAQLEERRSAAVASFAAGDLGADVLASVTTALTARTEEISGQLRAMSSMPRLPNSSKDFLVVDLLEKRAIIGALLVATVSPGKPGGRAFDDQRIDIDWLLGSADDAGQ